MANTNIKFYKVASMPEALTVGGIYFNDADHTIRIATSATASTIYAGIKDATYANDVLTIFKSDNSTIRLDLSDVASASAMAAALKNKVDKVDGKGLSTNDYTTAEKNKLSGIADGAQVNTIESIKVNGTALTIDDHKAVNISVPAVPVTGVNDNDPLLSLTNNKLVKSEIGLKYDAKSKKIQLTGKGGAVITGAEIDATNFIKDGMLENAELVKNPAGQDAGTYLKLSFNTDAGSKIVYANVTDLIDVYTGGTGISISGKSISVNKNIVDGWIDTKVNAAKDEINGTIDALDATSIDLATGFAAATTYAAPAAGDTVQVAIGKLTKGVADAKVSGVTSFAGKTGAITVRGDQNATAPAVNLSMSNNELQATVVGVATSTQGDKADTALQAISATTLNEYLTLSAGSKHSNAQKISGSLIMQSISGASSSAKGLAEASDVKAYVDGQVSSVLVWEEFN